MNNEEIQIQFSKPGNWQEFTLTAVYQDADGYTRTAHYTADEIPADHTPAMQAVVAALVGLSEPWQVVQVWARLKEICARQGDDPVRTVETVDLTVGAVNSQGGRRIFTARDYPEFTVSSPAAVDFFKYFTKQNHE